MSGYERAQYLSQCYLNSTWISVAIYLLIAGVAYLFYLQKKKDKVKGKKNQEQHRRVLQKCLMPAIGFPLCAVLAIILVLPCWKDNRLDSFNCVTGIYERDFPPVNWYKHPITITDENGDEVSLIVAAGYFAEGSMFSGLDADKAFPEGRFKAKVYYGEHSGLAFYMEILP